MLAGGLSSRMGEDKALMAYAGTTLLAHVVGVVAGVAGAVVVAADSRDRYSAANLPSGTILVGDNFPGAGPLGGLVSGLIRAGEGYHVVTACDMPGLVPELLRLLFNEAEGFDGAIPLVGGREEPLCAVYHRRCAEMLQAEMLSGSLALRRAVQSLNLRRVGEDRIRAVDPQLASFTNLNTPDDYKRAI